MDIKGRQYYHSGYVNYNNNSLNNGMNCGNGFYVYCCMHTHTQSHTLTKRNDYRTNSSPPRTACGSDWTQNSWFVNKWSQPPASKVQFTAQRWIKKYCWQAAEAKWDIEVSEESKRRVISHMKRRIRLVSQERAADYSTVWAASFGWIWFKMTISSRHGVPFLYNTCTEKGKKKKTVCLLPGKGRMSTAWKSWGKRSRLNFRPTTVEKRHQISPFFNDSLEKEAQHQHPVNQVKCSCSGAELTSNLIAEIKDLLKKVEKTFIKRPIYGTKSTQGFEHMLHEQRLQSSALLTWQWF